MNLLILVSAIALIGLILPNQNPSPTTTATANATSTPSAEVEPTSTAATSSQTSPASTTPEPEPTQVEPQQTSDPVNNSTSLQDLVLQLEVASEVVEGYDRDLFKHWIDADGDGCNTRKEVLISEAKVEPQVSGDCDLSGGQWYSSYDEVTTADPSDFDIDHFVPLNEAWQSGAYAWSAEKREEFANDLGFDGSLIAVTASSNRSKSDRDPADWLPVNIGYRCSYVTNWVQVKIRWGLSVDKTELATIKEFGKTCK